MGVAFGGDVVGGEVVTRGGNSVFDWERYVAVSQNPVPREHSKVVHLPQTVIPLVLTTTAK